MFKAALLMKLKVKTTLSVRDIREWLVIMQTLMDMLFWILC